jgi:hypothetical protein
LCGEEIYSMLIAVDSDVTLVTLLMVPSNLGGVHCGVKQPAVWLL